MEEKDKRIPHFREIVLSGSSNRATTRESSQIHMRENKPVACRLGKAPHNLWANCEGSVSGNDLRKLIPLVA
jgi:hypothetical protein